MALGLESNLLNELKPMQRVTDRPIAVDLFAGAGGLSEGFREAGFFVALAVEKDAQAAATYSYNHCRWKSKYRSQVLNQDVS
jgi:DNA (cytosine-5)-methyltransferase 1